VNERKPLTDKEYILSVGKNEMREVWPAWMVIHRAIDAIVKACGPCGGSGFVVTYKDGHGCNGTEENCAATCPIQLVHEEDCEYCGRPKVALLELLKSEFWNPETRDDMRADTGISE
jgi:hypothetical protein